MLTMMTADIFVALQFNVYLCKYHTACWRQPFVSRN